MIAPIYFFGCLDEAGHYLFSPDRQLLTRIGPFTLAMLDGSYCPNGGTEDERRERITYVAGWTVMSKWDRSVDSRPGSHATFVALGTFTSAQMWMLARVHFPMVAARLERVLA